MTRRGWVLFGAMCVIWGVPYLFIKIAVRDLSPATLVFGRTVLAALLLLPPASRRGYLRPLLARWVPVLLFTVVEIAVPWWLLASGEQRLSSSLTALLIAAVPLIGAVLARTTGSRERLGWRALTGLGFGLVGVAALVGFNTAGVSLTAVAEVGAVAVCYAVGPIILDRHLRDLPALGVIAGSLALYVNPAVAAVAGVGFLGESFTAGMGAGFALILAGSTLATRRRPAVALEPPLSYCEATGD